MVLLHGKTIISPRFVHQHRHELTLAVHRISRDDSSLQVKQLRELESSRNFIGLFVDEHLGEGNAGFRAVEAQELMLFSALVQKAILLPYPGYYAEALNYE